MSAAHFYPVKFWRNCPRVTLFVNFRQAFHQNSSRGAWKVIMFVKPRPPRKSRNGEVSKKVVQINSWMCQFSDGARNILISIFSQHDPFVKREKRASGSVSSQILVEVIASLRLPLSNYCTALKTTRKLVITPYCQKEFTKRLHRTWKHSWGQGNRNGIYGGTWEPPNQTCDLTRYLKAPRNKS